MSAVHRSPALWYSGNQHETETGRRALADVSANAFSGPLVAIEPSFAYHSATGNEAGDWRPEEKCEIRNSKSEFRFLVLRILHSTFRTRINPNVAMNVIKLSDVKKVYRNRLTPEAPTVAFRLDEFVVTEGERVALTGPSGCGKSTLLNLMSGLLRPDSGSVEVDGVCVNQLGFGVVDRFRGKHIGYVFQDFNLVPALTALENVRLGLRFGRTVPRIQWAARAREMLDKVGLGHRRGYRPDRLSIGEKQRVAIARALVNHPPIILADEPTGSLDPATGAQVFELLMRMCDEARHTLLVVTHDQSIAQRLERRFDATHLIHESDHPQ